MSIIPKPVRQLKNEIKPDYLIKKTILPERRRKRGEAEKEKILKFSISLNFYRSHSPSIILLKM